MSESDWCRRRSDLPQGTGFGLREKSSTLSGWPQQSEPVSRFMSLPKSFGCTAQEAPHAAQSETFSSRNLLIWIGRLTKLSNLRTQLRRVFVRWKGRLRRASSGDFVPLFDDLQDVPVTQSTAVLTRKSRKGRKP